MSFAPRLTLAPEQIEDVGLALMTLTHEVAVLADRVRVLEHVLDERGIDVSDAIDRYQPDAQTAAALSAQTRALVERVVSALAGAAPQNPPDA